MTTIKITELPLIAQLNANTSNTLFVGVDVPTLATGQFTVHTLAQGLYSNEILNVGQNQQNLPNTVAQFSASGNSYIQTNLVNTNDGGSADIVVTANGNSGGTDSTNFIDVGYANKYYQPGSEFNNIGTAIYPLDGYLYVQGTASSNGGNLVIGTTTSGTNLRFIVGGGTAANIVAKMTSTGLTMNTGTTITFADGSVQSVAASPANYSQSGYAQANVTVGVDATQNSRMTIIEGTDVSQNNRMTINENTDLSQNVRLDYSNTALTIVQGVDVGQNTRLTVIEGTDVSQNTRIDYSNAAITIIQGTDVGQNTRLTVIENTDLSQNTRLDYSNAAITIIQGTDVGQNSRMTIIEGTNLSQNTRLDYSNAAITIIQATNVTQNTNITSTDGKMQSAYNTANNALANTSGTFAGNLTITGNLLTQGTVSLNNSSFNANSPFIKITASNNYTTVAPSNTNYMLQITGKANTVTRVVLDSFGQNSYPVLIGRMGRGSADAPAATQNNDVMMRIVGNGYTGTQFPSSSPTKIDFVAAENITDLARGTQIQFWNTPNGSNTIQRVATLNADSATFLGTVNPTKGFIYTPLVYPSAQTAITIDFANNSMVRAQTSSGIVVSMSNYTVGKIVEVWITNLSGLSQNYTTGVSSINSTLNATTYAIPATSTVCARYFCVDGTLANTLVSVIHA